MFNVLDPLILKFPAVYLFLLSLLAIYDYAGDIIFLITFRESELDCGVATVQYHRFELVDGLGAGYGWDLWQGRARPAAYAALYGSDSSQLYYLCNPALHPTRPTRFTNWADLRSNFTLTIPVSTDAAQWFSNATYRTYRSINPAATIDVYRSHSNLNIFVDMSCEKYKTTSAWKASQSLFGNLSICLKSIPGVPNNMLLFYCGTVPLGTLWRTTMGGDVAAREELTRTCANTIPWFTSEQLRRLTAIIIAIITIKEGLKVLILFAFFVSNRVYNSDRWTEFCFTSPLGMLFLIFSSKYRQRLTSLVCSNINGDTQSDLIPLIFDLLGEDLPQLLLPIWKFFAQRKADLITVFTLSGTCATTAVTLARLLWAIRKRMKRDSANTETSQPSAHAQSPQDNFEA